MPFGDEKWENGKEWRGVRGVNERRRRAENGKEWRGVRDDNKRGRKVGEWKEVERGER